MEIERTERLELVGTTVWVGTGYEPSSSAYGASCRRKCGCTYCMVLEALLRQPAYPMLPEQEREILWAAALLHDVEKRSTSVDEGNGQVTSKNHAKRGETTVRTLLYRDIPAPFKIREHIASLVRHHGLPIWLMEREDPLKCACEASLRLDTSLLKQLTVADICGRISTDKEVLLEATEFLRCSVGSSNVGERHGNLPMAQPVFTTFIHPDPISIMFPTMILNVR